MKKSLDDSATKFRNDILHESISAIKLNTYTDNYDPIMNDLYQEDRSLYFDVDERIFYLDWFNKNYIDLYNSYKLLSDFQSCNLFKRLICYRLAGFHSYKIEAKYTKQNVELDLFKKSENRSESKLSNDGFFGKIFHYDFEFQNSHYIADCDSLESYLHRRQYFYHEDDLRIEPELGDILIDGGGCLGDSAAVFSNAVGPQGRVFSFDPIADHIEMINFNASQFQFNNVTAIASGLSNYINNSEPLRIGGFNPAFRANFDALPMTTIDTFFSSSKLEKVDFIKLDVEGSEINALKGAQRTISICMPKLAISIYHKPNDLFEILNFINLIFPFYTKFSIGHYSIHQGETVLYVTK
jgi:FkbM family methyltransferase